ncbi:WD40-repeat-containing domain protein [Syncephalis fuscata]|nr:WD40-repeat-containing domain protein [Syncephalis fuscata]
MATNNSLSEYELARLENIRRNQEVLASLNIPSVAAPPLVEKRKPAASQRSPTVKRKTRTEDKPPIRKSARLRGETPKLTKEMLAMGSPEPSPAPERFSARHRERIEDNIALVEAADVSGRGGQAHFAQLLESIVEAGLGPQGKVDKATAHDVAQLRETFSQLRVHHDDEGTVKVTPERIYCAAFHPSRQLLVAAGDKSGTLGFWDAGATLSNAGQQQSNFITAKKEENNDKENDKLLHNSAAKSRPGSLHSRGHKRNVKVEKSIDDDGDAATEETEDRPDPVYTYTAHAGTLPAMKYTPDGSRLFTSSYDGTIRYLDMAAQRFLEAYRYEPTPNSEDPRELLIGSVDIDPVNANIIWFSTNDGRVGRCDTRMRSNSSTAMYPLLEKKIGCISMNPGADKTHYISTASLDRTLRIWDTRKLLDTTSIEAVSEFAHGKSVTSAYWSADGSQLVSSSYDDTLRIFDTKTKSTPSLKSPIKIRHNCQTGRWVTMLRANWIQHERDHPSFLIGNMRRSIDMFSGITGELVWSLTAPLILTAVPAVAVAHPSMHAVVGGTASGRMLIWSL